MYIQIGDKTENIFSVLWVNNVYIYTICGNILLVRYYILIDNRIVERRLTNSSPFNTALAQCIRTRKTATIKMIGKGRGFSFVGIKSANPTGYDSPHHA